MVGYVDKSKEKLELSVQLWFPTYYIELCVLHKIINLLIELILLQYLCNGCCPECPFSNASNAYNGALGPSSVHPHIAYTFGDEKACFWARSAQVSNEFLVD